MTMQVIKQSKRFLRVGKILGGLRRPRPACLGSPKASPIPRHPVLCFPALGIPKRPTFHLLSPTHHPLFTYLSKISRALDFVLCEGRTLCPTGSLGHVAVSWKKLLFSEWLQVIVPLQNSIPHPSCFWDAATQPRDKAMQTALGKQSGLLCL